MIVPNGYFDAARRALRKTEKSAMNDAQIKHMVSRFLGWKLPENFAPDAGISFKPTFNDHLTPPSRHDPSGTNLFDCNQAEAMVRYMIEGLPASTAPASPPSSVGEEAIGSERIKDALRKLIRNHHLARDVSEVYYKRINQNWRDASGLVRKPSVDPLIPALAFIEAAEDEAAR